MTPKPRLYFLSANEVHPVLTRGAPRHADIVLIPTGTGAAMACLEPAMSLEHGFPEAPAKVARFEFNATGEILMDGGGNQLATLGHAPEWAGSVGPRLPCS